MTGAATEPTTADGLRVCEDTYWREYYLAGDCDYEWCNGRLEEKPVSDDETFLVYAWLGELLRHYLRARPLARMVGLDMGFRLSLPTGTVIRRPDLGIVRNDNPHPLLPLDLSYHGTFDLCIEALSDKDRRGRDRDLVVKKAEYAAAGVPEYFIIHRDPARQAFYQRNAAGVYVPIATADGVLRSQVLPGLQFRLSDLHTQRGPEDLCQDPVYAGYVLPGWQVLTQQARVQTERAEAEATARRAAERELADLRARVGDGSGSESGSGNG